MSLHVLANHMSSKGRNGDSMLVHMTPHEVAGLQALAMKHGGSLTINPDTGLPEANFLKKLLPMIAGFALGPAGMGIAFGGLSSAASAGLLVGGVTGLATGSLSKGLMAGLGAYGGAGLGDSLMGAGSASIGSAAEGLQGPIGSPESGFGATQAIAAAPKADVLSAGFNAATSSPTAAMSFAKQNMMPLAAAASPIMADMMVPTATKAPTNTNPAYIRQYVTGDRPQAPRALAPVLASEWGARNFADAYATPMAGGGIVALAGGGDYTTLTKDSSAEDIASAYKQFTTASGGDTAANQQAAIDYLTNLGIGQDTIGQAYGTYQASPTYTAYTDAQMGSFLSNPANKDINLDQAIIDTNANPADVNRYIASLASPFVGSTDTTGGSGTLGIYNRMVAEGIDPTEYYNAVIRHDPKYAGWSKEDITRGYNLDKGAYALSKELGGNVSDKGWVKFMDDNKYSINDAAQAFGLSRNEVQRRYDAVKAAEKTTPQTYAPPGTTNPYRNVNNPGDIITNPDGTRTVVPNIPGRPDGGFIGIQQLKDAYTAGGGSLGYTSRAPRTIDEFNQLYNKQTGDSLAAYDYLMGKGGGKYPAKSMASQIAVPYAEYALGKKTVGLKPITKTTGTSTTTFKEPQTYFDEKAYLAANPDVEAEMKAGKSNFASAYEHYLRYGKAEGRKFTGDYDSYLAAVEAEKARIANAANSANAGGDDGGAAAAAAAASAADSAAASAASASGTAPGSDGSPGSGAKRGGLMPRGYAVGGGLGSLGSYSDGGRLLKGPGDGVSDSIPATIGAKQQPARLADGEFVIPARIVSELGNGSTDAGAKKLYAMMDRVQRARGKTTGKNKVAANSRADKYLPA
jgi:hypothetical protein